MDRAVRNQRRDVCGRQLGYQGAVCVLHTGHIGQKQQPVSLQRCGDGTCSRVAINVECLAISAAAEGRDDRHDVLIKQPAQDRWIYHRRCPDKPQIRMCLIAGDQPGIFPRKANRATALLPDGLHDAFVDHARQHHFDHFDSGGIRHTFAIHKLGLDVQLVQHRVDHGAATMHDHRVYADLTHQHHVTGKAFHGGIAAHGMPTQFDNHRRTRITLEIGQRVRQGLSRCDPVLVHNRSLCGCFSSRLSARDLSARQDFSQKNLTPVWR